MLYFAVPTDSGEELVLAGGIHPKQPFQLLPKSQVSDPRVALFMVTNKEGEVDEVTEVEAENGSGKSAAVSPGDAIQLRHLFYESFIGWKDKSGTLILMSEVSRDSSVSFSLQGDEKRVKKEIREGDAVPIVGKMGVVERVLGHDFWFKGLTKDRWVVRKYGECVGDTSDIHFGQAISIRAINGMYVSVLPNTNNSGTLFLTEEQQSADCLSDLESISLPEYSGPLRIDLTTDGEDANSVWVFEREDRFVGGILQSGEQFYMHHIASGRFLGSNLSLGPRSEAKPFLLKSVDGDSTIGLREFLEFQNDDNKLVSADTSCVSENLSTWLLHKAINSLPRDSTIQQKLVLQAADRVESPLTFEVIPVSVSDANILERLAMYMRPLAVWRTALQNISKLRNAEDEVIGVIEGADMSYFEFAGASGKQRANFASDMQLFFEFFRINLLEDSCEVKLAPKAGGEKVLRAAHYFQDFERPISALLSRKHFLSPCFQKMLSKTCLYLNPGLQIYIPKEAVQLFWSEVCMSYSIADFAGKTNEDILQFLDLLLDRSESSITTPNLSFVKTSGKFDVEFFPNLEIRWLSETTPLHDLQSDSCESLMRAIALLSDFCSDPGLREEVIAGTGLTAKMALRVYQGREDLWRMNAALLNFVAKVHLPMDLGRDPISKLLKTKVISIQSANWEHDQSQWFFYPKADSPIADFVKEEVYFWLSTIHKFKEAPELWCRYVMFHMRLIEKLIDFDAVSDIFVCSTVTAISALVMWVFEDANIDGISERFSGIRCSEGAVNSHIQSLIETYLELIRVYQKWKTIKVFRKLVAKGTPTSQDEMSEICAELHCKTIGSKYFDLFGNLQNADPQKVDNALIQNSSEVLVNSLKSLLDKPSLSVESVLLYIFNTKEFHCRGNPVILLDLIDFELNTPRCLTLYFQECLDMSQFSEYAPPVEEIRRHPVSLLELETYTSESVKELPQLVAAMEELAKFALKFSGESATNFQVFLSKFEFLVDLERMWQKCLAVGSQFAEEKLNVRLRSLTMELTRLYLSGNEANRNQVLGILPVQAFYPEYPQYIRLVRELELFDSRDKIAVGMVSLVFPLTKTTSRSSLAIKELLRHSKDEMKIVFAILENFSRLEQDSLSVHQWAALLMCGKHLNAEVRQKWMNVKQLERWYLSSPESVHKEAATLSILSADKASERYQGALAVLEAKVLAISVADPDLEPSFEYLRNEKESNFILNEQGDQSELDLLVELLWEESDSLLSVLFSELKDERLSKIAEKFEAILWYLWEKSDFQFLSKPLISQLSEYYSSLAGGEKLGERRVHFERLKALPELSTHITKVETQVPPPKPIFDIAEFTIKLVKSYEYNYVMPPINKHTKPVVIKLLENQYRTWDDFNDPFSDKWKKGEPVISETFEKLRKLLLSKTLRREFLSACKLASFAIIPKVFFGNEKSLKVVVKNLLDFAVSQNDDGITNEVLTIVTFIIRKVEKVRDHLLELLKERRYYIQVFSMFSSLAERQFALIEKMKEFNGSDSINKVFEVNYNAVEAFMALFIDACDGCYTQFQDYLREQEKGSQNNIPILLIIAKIAMQFLDLLSEESEAGGANAGDRAKAERVVKVETANHILSVCCRTLVEAISGPCSGNQAAILTLPGFLEKISSFIYDCSMKEVLSDDLKALILDIIAVVLALLEGKERNFKELGRIIVRIDFSNFGGLAKRQSTQCAPQLIAKLKSFQDSDSDRLTFNLITQSLLVCLNTYNIESLASLRDEPFSHYISSVEIKVEEPEPAIRFLSFPVPNYCFLLDSEAAVRIISEVDRESREVKLSDFIGKLHYFIIDTRTQGFINTFPYVAKVVKWWKYYWYCSFIFVFLINVLLICVLDEQDALDKEEKWWNFVLAGLGIAQVTSSFLGTISFYLKYYYLLMKEYVQKRSETTEMEKLPTLESPGASIISYLRLRGNESYSDFNSDEVLKALIRFGYSVAALIALWYPYLYPLLLFQIINLNDSIVNILKSITMRGSQLILIFLFSLIVIYVFSFIAFLSFPQYFEADSNMDCHSLSACFMSIFNMGLRSGGGVGDALSNPDANDYLFRVSYDLIFYIIITTVLMAIVFGLIVDTFSELRDEKNQFEYDMNNVCFICGHSRSVIELKGEGWKAHTLFVHNPFAYLYFLSYVEFKYSNDCSGIEKMVQEKLFRKDISFFPASSGILMKNGVGEGQD